MAKTAEPQTQTTLTNEQVSQLLKLLKGVDSVELKATVPDSDHRSSIAALGMDALDAQIRQVFFFDTPELTLNDAGVVVRARRVQGKTGDTVVKLRPVVPDELPPDVRSSRGLGIEVDAMPGGFVCSASLKGVADNAAVRETVLNGLPIRKLFSKEQRAFFKEHAPDGMKLDDLQVLGPIFVLKLKFAPKGFNRRLVAELWFYPDQTRILELSTKCTPAETFQAAAETRGFLHDRGIDLSGAQQTKTKTALEFFSKEIREGDVE
jgi:hypothetical protein